MFNNPLRKYQIGGNISEDQAMQQVVEFISQVAKVSPEEVVTKLDQIKGDENAVKLLSEALELAKNNDERGFQAIQQIFNPQATGKFAKGGKLHDFICKHAKGGYIAGCECGKNVIKAQNAVPKGIPNPYANYEMLRDTNYVNSNGDRIYEIYLKNNRGEGLKYSTLNGKDPIGISGYISDDNKFINEGDGTVNLEALKQRLAEISKVKSEKEGGKFQEKNQKATFVNFSYPEHNYSPEEAEAYQRQATEAALDAMGANDGNGIVLVTVNNEQPMTTPTVFSIPSRNNAPIIGNLDKNSDKLNTLALLNLGKDEQNEEETQNRSDLVYRPFRSSIVDYLKSEGIIKTQEGGVLKAQGGVGKAGKAIMEGAKWIKSASGNRILVDNTGKVIMKEIVPGRSGATPAAAKILKHRDPFEVHKATDYADRMMIHREYNDFPWSVKQSAFEVIHPGESLFQPWKPRTIKVDIKNPTVESNVPIGKYNWNSASSVPDEKYMGLQIPDKYIK